MEFIVINQEKRISYNKSCHFTSLFHISWINVWKCESGTIYKGSGLEISKLIFTYPKALEKVNSDAKLKKTVINSWSIVLLHIIFSLSYIKMNNIQHYDIQLLFCAKKNLWKAPTSHSMPVLKCLKMRIWNHLPGIRIRNFQNNFPIFNYYWSNINGKVYSKIGQLPKPYFAVKNRIHCHKPRKKDILQ